MVRYKVRNLTLCGWYTDFFMKIWNQTAGYQLFHVNMTSKSWIPIGTCEYDMEVPGYQLDMMPVFARRHSQRTFFVTIFKIIIGLEFNQPFCNIVSIALQLPLISFFSVTFSVRAWWTQSCSMSKLLVSWLFKEHWGVKFQTSNDS